MNYEQHVLRILLEVGPQGISVGALAKHVYNRTATLFFQPDRQDIHRYVQQYLLQSSKSPQSLIESAGRRGYYRLNTSGSADARQLLLRFREEAQPAAAEPQPQPDLSLDLFDQL